MSKVHYSPEARRDMDRLWEHISYEFQNPSAAQSLINNIMKAVDQLEVFPVMGTPLCSIAEDPIGYRFLVVRNYLIFYRLYGSDVYIDRILYGRSDCLRILLGDLSGKEYPE